MSNQFITAVPFVTPRLPAEVGGGRKAGPVREGPALLQGRVICGICGKRMGVHYDIADLAPVSWENKASDCRLIAD